MAAFVSLIGAGPGDPELITVRGQRALAAADVVMYDDLVDRRLLLACAGRPLYGLGDRRAPAEQRQRVLYNMLAEQARAGRRVAHLKGGDPLLYGRGAEEIQFLRAAGIAYEVVPGITAAAGAAAYAELPLTRRRQASSVALCTGHTGQVAVPEADTLVYYMAATRLAEVARQVLAGGRAPDTPVALVRNATRPEQSVATMTLAEAARLPSPEPPLVVVIGPGGAPLAGGVDSAAADVIAKYGLAGAAGAPQAREREDAAAAGTVREAVRLAMPAPAPGAGPIPAGASDAAPVSEAGGVTLAASAGGSARAAAGIARPSAAAGAVPRSVRVSGPGAGGVAPRPASAPPPDGARRPDLTAGGGTSDGAAARRATGAASPAWFAAARKVLVTGTSAEPYRYLGEVVHTPLIKIADPEDWRPLEAAVDSLATYSLVVFTSRFAVAALVERLLARGGDARRLAGARLAAIGRATAGALRSRGLAADVVAAAEHTGGLLAALRSAGPVAGERVLVPRSALADDTLPEALRAAGAEVAAVTAYRNVPAPHPVRVDLAAQDAVVFTSPSTVAAFRVLYGDHIPPALALWCRGPRTCAAARAAFGRGERPPEASGRQNQARLPRAAD